MDKYDLVNRSAHIWNFDNSGISLYHNLTKIYARCGGNPHVVTAGRSANTTVIAAFGAMDESYTLSIIFKGDSLTRETTSGDISGTVYKK